MAKSKPKKGGRTKNVQVVEQDVVVEEEQGDVPKDTTEDQTTKYMNETGPKIRSKKYFNGQKAAIPKCQEALSRSASPDRDQFVWKERGSETEIEARKICEVDEFLKACPHLDRERAMLFLVRNSLEAAIELGMRARIPELVPDYLTTCYGASVLNTKKEKTTVEDIPIPENNILVSINMETARTLKSTVVMERLLGVAVACKALHSPIINIDTPPRQFGSVAGVKQEPLNQDASSEDPRAARMRERLARHAQNNASMRPIVIKQELDTVQNILPPPVLPLITIKRELDTSGEEQPENSQKTMDETNGQQLSARAKRLQDRTGNVGLSQVAVAKPPSYPGGQLIYRWVEPEEFYAHCGRKKERNIKKETKEELVEDPIATGYATQEQSTSSYQRPSSSGNRGPSTSGNREPSTSGSHGPSTSGHHGSSPAESQRRTSSRFNHGNKPIKEEPLDY